MSDPHLIRNRRWWDAQSDAYQDRHGAQLEASGGMAWGVWQIPERELQVLGEVAGRHVLELGCGAAQWSIALAKAGARPVGLDFSARQLAHARDLMRHAGAEFPLIQASAEQLPVADGRFDLAFCDHGALTFADPRRTVPEAARVLRRGGLLAFSHASPILDLCWRPEADQVGERLEMDYFGMHRLEGPDTVAFQLPYGEWVALFRESGLEVEALIEPRPAADATSSYRDDHDRAWSRRWPAESIWKARKR
jgi:SAM-dependent methyltransferase